MWRVPGRDDEEGWLYEGGIFKYGGVTTTTVLASAESNGPTQTPTDYLATILDVGWPCRTVRGEWYASYPGGAGGRPAPTPSKNLIAIPPRLLGVQLQRPVLPFFPLFPGVVIGAAFWGILAWVVVRIVRVVRRRARLDRRCCAQCRYALRESTVRDGFVVCQECGVSVPAAHFRRPRQVLRWWMVPLLLPAAVLGIAWLLGLVVWTWLRFELRFQTPILSFDSMVSLVAAVVWVYGIGVVAYRDRAGWRRQVLAVAVAGGLAIPAYVAVFALVARFAPGL